MQKLAFAYEAIFVVWEALFGQQVNYLLLHVEFTRAVEQHAVADVVIVVDTLLRLVDQDAWCQGHPVEINRQHWVVGVAEKTAPCDDGQDHRHGDDALTATAWTANEIDRGHEQ